MTDGGRPIRDSLIKRILALPKGVRATTLQITKLDLDALRREEGQDAPFDAGGHLAGSLGTWRGLEIKLIDEAGPHIHYTSSKP